MWANPRTRLGQNIQTGKLSRLHMWPWFPEKENETLHPRMLWGMPPALTGVWSNCQRNNDSLCCHYLCMQTRSSVSFPFSGKQGCIFNQEVPFWMGTETSYRMLLGTKTHMPCWRNECRNNWHNINDSIELSPESPFPVLDGTLLVILFPRAT